ncbi:MAG: zinc-ribbon domain-containing protein [Candidatus Hodarchaeota archaeon]
MVFCAKCGQENPNGATTCSKCGVRLSPSTRPQKARRSSDVCWEEEQKGPGRGGIIVIGIVFICISILIYTAIRSPEDFAQFFENLGQRLEQFFTSATFQETIPLIGGAVLILIGLAIILAGLRKGR